MSILNKLTRRSFFISTVALISQRVLAGTVTPQLGGSINSISFDGGGGGNGNLPIPVWARVQGAKSTTGSGTTVNLAFPATVTNGNIIVGGMLLVSDALPTNITDDKSNQY